MRLEDHHVIARQRIEIAVGEAAVRRKLGYALTDGERRLLETPLRTVLRDRRNIVPRMTRRRHHRATHGFERLRPSELPDGIDEFAADYGLEAALERELRLIGTVGSGPGDDSAPAAPRP